ncbi:RHS repeat-associated core domain-containing protein [Lujinxingia sediminis]|uniref:RHS repeat-associated core domain-containing protein n=1 Tax=Lujinxingia sediminis TaxID=2480984 RepID=A0ABY0CP21_9DELT|nr:RHS repeat-associated core domain-containing protein [Lujinxingia sediminis]
MCRSRCGISPEYAEYDLEGRISARAPDDTENCSERNLAETPCHIGSLPHFGFTGAFRSTTTGLYRFGARWYSPRFGQFMSPDPLWYVDSFDVYGYAAFDPVNRWDPSGMASKGMGMLESLVKRISIIKMTEKK